MVFDVRADRSLTLAVYTTLVSASMVVLLTWLYLQARGLGDAVRLYAPPGQTLYVLSRWVALGAFVLLCWQLISSVLQRGDRVRHVLSGLVILLMVAVHAGLFVSAVSMRQGELALAMLLPDFTQGYYQQGLSFGVLGLLSLLFAAAGGAVAARSGKRWLKGHRLVYLAVVFTALHAYMIGSDISLGVLLLLILPVLIVSVAFQAYRKSRRCESSV